MEHSAKIIIGANYGDEGKGLVTRHFALQGLRDIRFISDGSAHYQTKMSYEND